MSMNRWMANILATAVEAAAGDEPCAGRLEKPNLILRMLILLIPFRDLTNWW